MRRRVSEPLERAVFFTIFAAGVDPKRVPCKESRQKTSGVLEWRDRAISSPAKACRKDIPDKVCDRISDEIVDLFFREGPRAGLCAQGSAGRLRNAGDHQSRDHRGRNPRAQIHHAGHGDRARPRRDQGHRLRAGRLSLEDGECRSPAACAVGRTSRQGVDASRQQGRRRRRPGHHVRLCLPRDAGTHAGAASATATRSCICWRRRAYPARNRSSAPTRRARSRCTMSNGNARRSDADRAFDPASRREA